MNYPFFNEEIRRYDDGKLSFDDTVQLFQNLVDSGKIIYMNNNHYVQANNLIDRGYVIKR